MHEHRPPGIPGRLALTLRTRLLQSALSAWPRRGKTLLEINSGDGTFLPLLWECGFDITAVESAPSLREKAIARVGCRVAVEAAVDDHLPFDDNAFDRVILHITAPDSGRLACAVAEALRVAADGLIVTYWNSMSLPWLMHSFGKGRYGKPTPVHNWWRVRRILKSFGIGRLHSLTTLMALPQIARYRIGDCACMHALPFGAWGIFRLDLAPPRSVKPMPLFLSRQKLRQPEPAMEYSRKNAMPPHE